MRDAVDAVLDVQRVGRGRNDAVRTFAGEQIGERFVDRDTRFARKSRGGGRGIDDGRKLAIAALPNQLDVSAPDQARARDRDTNLFHACQRSEIVKSMLERAWCYVLAAAWPSSSSLFSSVRAV